MDFNNLWEKCLDYNIEQKPEEFKQFLEVLSNQKNKKYALEIGSNYGGTSYALCHIYDYVISLDIKHHENFDKIKDEFPNYSYIISDSTSSFASSSLTNSESSVSFVYPNPNVEPKAYDLNKIFEETEGNVENIVEFFMKEFVDETKFLKLTKMINRENSFNRRKLHEKPNSIHPEQNEIFQRIANTAYDDIAEEIESCDKHIAECIAEKKCLEILRTQLTGAIDTKKLNLMNKSFNKAIALKFVVVEEENKVD
jgi:hypothetical protein